MNNNSGGMEQKQINIAVIAPTNEGKTSFIRTLLDLQDLRVSAETGTTRTSESINLEPCYGFVWCTFYDTPGFQMSSYILELLEERLHLETGESYSAEQIINIIPSRDENYKHDKKAWETVQKSDIIIFVINIMENPNQASLQDTLTLLPRAIPIIFVYNFVKNEQNVSCDYYRQWQIQLKNRGYHQTQEYDAHRRSFENELRLWYTIRRLVQNTVPNGPTFHKQFDQEIEKRRNQENKRLDDSRHIITDFLIKLACQNKKAYNVSENEQDKYKKQIEEELKIAIFESKYNAYAELYRKWGYEPRRIQLKEYIDIFSEFHQKSDYFGKEGKTYLKGCGYCAAIGASIGVVVDLLCGGLSLGIFTALGVVVIGGTIGAVTNGVYHFIYDKHSKILTVKPSKDDLDKILSHVITLLKELKTRGKAIDNEQPIEINDNLQIMNKEQREEIINALIEIQNLKRGFVFSQKKSRNLENRILQILEQIFPPITKEQLDDFK